MKMGVFSLHHRVQNGSGAYTTSYSNGMGALSPGQSGWGR